MQFPLLEILASSTCTRLVRHLNVLVQVTQPTWPHLRQGSDGNDVPNNMPETEDSLKRHSDLEVDKMLEEVEKYTLASHLFWGLWGVISEHVNEIDFDYMEYARQRFQERLALHFVSFHELPGFPRVEAWESLLILILLTCKQLSSDVANHMIRNVSDQEIREAMFVMGDNKAPGPDGYTAAFFKEAWDIIAIDVTKAIKEFFTNGVFLKKLNHTILALIPKKNDGFQMVGKKKKRKALNDEEEDEEEEVENVYDESANLYTKTGGSLSFTTGAVDWNFLYAVLIGFGFHPRMIGWIMECVTFTSFSISINGSLHGYFKGKRGLRQGDPMSLYLFTLVMEVLTLMFHRKARVSRSFTYHRYCSKLNLINFCFVDDLFLFAHGDADSARVIMDTLVEFKEALGLTSSFPKSTAYFCNVLNYTKLDILNILPFEEGKLPVKYLGVPLVHSRLLYWDCKELMEKVKGRINDWKTKSLSFAGRVQLIGSESLWVYGFIPINSMATLFGRFLFGERCHEDGGKFFSAGYNRFAKVKDIIVNTSWSWPDAWMSKYSILGTIDVPHITDTNDTLVWKDLSNVDVGFSVANVWDCLGAVERFTGVPNIPSSLDAIVDFLLPIG
nr:hypothetical protein [Tanacetum cinerariifolium]